MDSFEKSMCVIPCHPLGFWDALSEIAVNMTNNLKEKL